MGEEAMNTSSGRVVLLILAAVTIAVAVIAAVTKFQALGAQAKNFAGFGTLIVNFFTLIVVALFIERVVEVFTKAYRAPRREALERELAARTAAAVKKDPPAPDATREIRVAHTALVAAASDEVGTAEAALRDYRSATRVYAFFGSTVLGLLVALAGVRALALFVTPPGPGAPESWLFVLLDVVITGFLLAGGAEGLHKIVDTFTTWMDETKKGLKS
jgi:hypothetical protein